MTTSSANAIIVERLAAFSEGDMGGNPAGVVIRQTLPDPAEMQAIAKEVGYSETAFAAPIGQDWRVRYFAPEIEVPFCGHATIALGAALAMRHGDGLFRLHLNDARITVEGRRTDRGLAAALQSPPTRSAPAEPQLVEEALRLFDYRKKDLDPRLPPAIAEAGARHLILALADRARLAAMRYELPAGRQLMLANGFATISLIHAEGPQHFRSRNPFAAGGVYEDPATGAAAAALAGYLRDIGWPHGGSIEIMQGEDMGVPSRLRVEFSDEPGASVRVSGSARVMPKET
ncbi:PhzF family phenazine biosynthesis protein [Sphingomonas oleivorans]|uniref:PhzF family phenazine biosynthesis protein n=1 Tax=Sphingomonas oleivorans TaxID=1735121 RepID=A0A2T5FZD9_9SPHN|nr:PhzF family phenazine biosynthesis protein [Sphingomonas oleivorans]PTQ12068.1 PhzF family phenazine biosynthesis protein [Sphingomonas oleivorans]